MVPLALVVVLVFLRGGPVAASRLRGTATTPGVPCLPPADDFGFLAPSYHVILTLNGTAIHCADAAAAIHLDGIWHWWLGCQGGWRHLTSKNLVDWHADLQPVSGQGGDTGSVSVTPSGIYSVLPGCGGICRRVALDRSLDKWGPATPAKLNGPSTPANFRDPTRPFQHKDGRWHITVGSGLRYGEKMRVENETRVGPMAFGMQYRATNDTLAEWEFASFIHTGTHAWTGASVDTYECPGVWPIRYSGEGNSSADHVVFEASMCSDECVVPPCNISTKQLGGSWNTHGEEWWVGTINAETKVLEVESGGHGAVDYGEYYCSKTAVGEDLLGRRVQFGFIEPYVNLQGNGSTRWHCPNKIISPEALPREVSMSVDGKRVLFQPVDELKALRIKSTTLHKTVLLKCGETTVLGDLGHAVEIRAAFTTTSAVSVAGTISFGVSVLGSADGKEITEIGLDGMHLFVNKTKSTERSPEPPIVKNYLTAPLASNGSGGGATTSALTIFLDGRVIESFVDGVPLTTLVYPKHKNSTLLGLFMRCGTSGRNEAEVEAPEMLVARNVTVSLDAWALRPIIISNTSFS